MACTVLIVDDDPHIRALLAAAMQDEGYDVLTAPDGQVALERAQQSRPALILLDYQLPCLDGQQFAAAYRQGPGPHAPIVLLTAGTSAQDRAAAVGAAAFLGKPFDVDALVEVVARFVA